jgi:SAM-dependent methyltransferase
VLQLESVPCPLCGERAARKLCVQRDLALGVPGWFALARCSGCGLLHQNPRVRADELKEVYPAGYAAHTREPVLSRTVRTLDRAGRRLLARHLGYQHLEPGPVPAVDRARGLHRRRRILKTFPPWIGQGRLLDVGCATGKFLRQMQAVGWHVAGIEFDQEAAAKATQITSEIFVGDPANAPFPQKSFDLVTAFHVIEHLPDPLGALHKMLGWIAPGGLVIVEVPNAAGLGARLFGRYWSGFDFPRHLVHFTPETMRAMVARAGGRIEREVHRSKPRYLIRSLRHLVADHDGPGAPLARQLVGSALGAGTLKLVLELALSPAPRLRLGEAVRYFIGPR